jgi:hypothetical protein
MNQFSATVELCRGALASGRPLILRVRGTSMLPTLWSGDCVSVRAAVLADLRPGDVAVFVRNRHLVVHRVIRRTEGAGTWTVVTRGDAQCHDDPPIEESELLGVAEAVHRFGKRRPLRRRMPAFARGVAWSVRRSPRVRSLLDRGNAVARRWGLAKAPPAVQPCCEFACWCDSSAVGKP